MSSAAIKPWVEVVQLHPDVLSEEFSEDIFALDLGPLADGNPNVPAVYRDAEHFFRASYLTNGLRSLLQDVLLRLGGGAGNRVLKLVTPFGGGKSPTLAALLHAVRNRKALDTIPEGQGLSRPGVARTAVFDGQFFDATKGKKIPGENFSARTMWGWIAWSLAGRKGYELLKAQDEARVAPGGDEILEILKEGPNLILLDEVLVAARKDQRREPVEGNEILAVIQRRLLAKIPDETQATPAATAHQEIVTHMRRAYARSAPERKQAEEAGNAP